LFYATSTGANDDIYFYIDNGNKFRLYTPDGSPTVGISFVESVVWSHIVVAFDSTQADANDRVRLYLNGLEISTVNSPTLNKEYAMNATTEHTIGEKANTSNEYYDGYMADVHFIDGQALGPEYFGRPSDNKLIGWVPKRYNGSYGTNGYFLEFGNSAALGNDTSGGNNNWTTGNVASYDQMLDTPTNNFCVLSTFDSKNSATIYEAGLAANTSGIDGFIKSTFSVGTGKWYWEVRVATLNNTAMIGIATIDQDPMAAPLLNPNLIAVNGADGNIYYDGADQGAYMSPLVNGDIIGIAIDLNVGQRTITFYKNNVSQGVVSTTISSETGWTPTLINRQDNFTSSVAKVNFGADSSFSGEVTRQFNPDYLGRGDFYYTPPNEHRAITANSFKGLVYEELDKPQNYYTVLTFNESTNPLSVKSFAQNLYPNELAVIKDYETSGTNYQLLDSLRDPDSAFHTDTASLEEPYVAPISFNSIAWIWRAGDGPPVGSTYGTVPSIHSVNDIGTFSIVRWTGTGEILGTVEHGLPSIPEMMIVKDLDNVSAPAYQYVRASGLPSVWGYWSTLGGVFQSNPFGPPPTPPDTLTFPVGETFDATSLNTLGHRYVAYLYNSKFGYCDFGTYTGTGFPYPNSYELILGWTPSSFMVRRVQRSDAVLVSDQIQMHNSRKLGKSIRWSSSAVETNLQVYFMSDRLFQSGESSAGVNYNNAGDVFWYGVWSATPSGGAFL